MMSYFKPKQRISRRPMIFERNGTLMDSPLQDPSESLAATSTMKLTDSTELHTEISLCSSSLSMSPLEPERTSRVKCTGKGKVDTIFSVGYIPISGSTSEAGTTLDEMRSIEPHALCDDSISSVDTSISLFSAEKKNRAEYVQGDIKGFWECPQCQTLPIKHRAKHSVIFHQSKHPPQEHDRPTIRFHIKHCQAAIATAKAKGIEVKKKELPEGPLSPSTLKFTVKVPKDKRKRKRSQSEYTKKNSRRIEKNSRTKFSEEKSSRRNSIKPVPIPESSTVLVKPLEDSKLTASIDVLLMSNVDRCEYIRAEDKTFSRRGRKLREGFPGIQCNHCNEKKWFFNCEHQVAVGLPKIEQHLIYQCIRCPREIKNNLILAKHQEEMERHILKTGKMKEAFPTRRRYAEILFERLFKKDSS